MATGYVPTELEKNSNYMNRPYHPIILHKEILLEHATLIYAQSSVFNVCMHAFPIEIGDLINIRKLIFCNFYDSNVMQA